MRAKDADQAAKLVSHIQSLRSSAEFLKKSSYELLILEIKDAEFGRPQTTARVSLQTVVDLLNINADELTAKAEKLGVEFK